MRWKDETITKQSPASNYLAKSGNFRLAVQRDAGATRAFTHIMWTWCAADDRDDTTILWEWPREAIAEMRRQIDDLETELDAETI